MNWRDFIIIGIAVGNIMFLYFNTPKKKLMRSLDRHIKDFVCNYVILRELMDKQYDLQQILEHYNAKTNRFQAIQYKFGHIDYLEYKNTMEMRRCFLLSGEYIIKLAEILEDNYSIVINSETDAGFMIVMEMLKDVRNKTMMLNEDANVVL